MEQKEMVELINTIISTEERLMKLIVSEVRYGYDIFHENSPFRDLVKEVRALRDSRFHLNEYFRRLSKELEAESK